MLPTHGLCVCMIVCMGHFGLRKKDTQVNGTKQQDINISITGFPFLDQKKVIWKKRNTAQRIEKATKKEV